MVQAPCSPPMAGTGHPGLVYRQVRDKWFSHRDGPKNGLLVLVLKG